VSAYDSERREFTRVSAEVPVRYRYLSDELEHGRLGETFETTTSNLSGGGLLLRAVIPDLDWLEPLLGGRMLLGVSLVLPGAEGAAQALARVAWIEGLEEGAREASLGLRFKEITREARDGILDFIIRSQMPD